MTISERELIEKLFAEINSISANDGPGVTRPSYSPQETAAMRVIERHAKELGLKTHWDFAANLHVVCDRGGLRGEELVTGSHLDTVPHGGRYDGTAGVIAGLVAVHRFQRDYAAFDVQQYPRRLIVFRGEESAWFGKCYLGSTALIGRLHSADLDRTNTEGQALGWCIAKEGGDPSAIARGAIEFDPRFTRAKFYEVHIEQGPVLHEAGEPIGIVTSIRGNHRYRGCRIIGESAHSGTTPRRLRKDPVLAFADLINRLNGGAKAFGEDLLMTCGVASTDPTTHAISAVASEVTFDLEFRSDKQLLLGLYDTFFAGVASSVIAQHGTNIIAPSATVTRPIELDQQVASDLVMHAAKMFSEDPDSPAPEPGFYGEPRSRIALQLPSGAGHDAAVFQNAGTPTGMIFIRNEHGSHNPNESMRMDDFMMATELLCRAMGCAP